MLIRCNGVTPRIGDNVLICEGAKVIGEVDIGDNGSVWFNCVLRGDVNSISIGANTNIQDLTMIHVWHRKENDNGFPVTIGPNVTVGHSCVIHGCTISNNCLIGMGSIIMDGAVIGENSIVGAGSLITKGKVFPPNSLIIGNPAKFVRELKKEEIEEIHNSAMRYISFAKAIASS